MYFEGFLKLFGYRLRGQKTHGRVKNESPLHCELSFFVQSLEASGTGGSKGRTSCVVFASSLQGHVLKSLQKAPVVGGSRCLLDE